MLLYSLQFSVIGLASAVHALASVSAAVERPTDDGYCNLIQPAPKAYACGTTGTLRGYSEEDSLTYYSSIDFSDCRDICLEWGLCLGFEYDSNTAGIPICSLYHADFYADSIQASNSTQTITSWSRYCWDCSAHCPPSTSVNLVVNGDFEYPSTGEGDLIPGWSAYPESGNQFQIVSPGHASPQAVEATGRHYLYLTQVFATCPNTLYMFSLDVKVVQLQPPSSNLFIAKFCDYTYMETGLTTASRWRTLTGFFQAYAYLPNVIELQMEPHGSLLHQRAFYDNINVTSFTGMLVPRPGASELLINNGFEDGKLAPWTDTADNGPGSVVRPGLNGSAFAFRKDDYFELHQDVVFKAGVSYLVSFDYQLLQAKSMFVNIILIQGEQVKTETASIYLDAAGTGHASRPFTGLAGAVSFNIFSSLGLVIDNISVKEFHVSKVRHVR